MAPELPVAVRPVVMHDQKIANALIFKRELPVIPVDVDLPEVAVRKIAEQHSDAALDEVDAGGFEWLEETRGEPDGDAVLDPGGPSSPGRESQPQRSRCAGPSMLPIKRSWALSSSRKALEVHIAIADPVLQGNAPLPSHLARCRQGMR